MKFFKKDKHINNIAEDALKWYWINDIRGLLFVVGMGLFVIFGDFTARVAQSIFFYFQRANWQTILDQSLSIEILVLITGNIIFTLASLYLIKLFLTRNKTFPMWFIRITTSSVIFSMCVAIFIKDMNLDSDLNNLYSYEIIIKQILFCAIWCTYILFSKRVKNTFIN
ncbi:hypothetical protein BH10PSE19_BH10PSE19_20630 [soil metagenome]